ncbi:hypothetical protein VAE151_630693 [Vibrio aestuarianus]|nr:hypothetical protein VAE115_380169 [Vibrio aestuarianus]CAH8238438.1 hypothetical protein VAE151_630693 [Vibrio aestuarianus]
MTIYSVFYGLIESDNLYYVTFTPSKFTYHCATLIVLSNTIY